MPATAWMQRTCLVQRSLSARFLLVAYVPLFAPAGHEILEVYDASVSLRLRLSPREAAPGLGHIIPQQLGGRRAH